MTGPVRFGPFELDAARGTLRRNGIVIRLQPQPLLVLATLVARAGEVVPREELQRALWPEGTFVDFDRGLNFCVNRIRRTLGEDARAPRYIETVARSGYRFIATVEACAPTRVDAIPPRESTAPRTRRSIAAGLAAMLLMIPGDAGPARTFRETDPAPAARIAYARGLYHARMAGGGAASLRLLEEAARLDPASSAVAAALAEAWIRAVQEGRATPRDGMESARRAAERALAKGDHPQAHLALGTIALRHDWDFSAADRHLERALALEPASANIHLELADLRLVQGRLDDAVREAERAERLDPVCPVVRGQVAGSYYAARRFTDAAAAWRRSTAVAPGLVGPHERLFHAYRHSARGGEAVAEAAEVITILGGPSSPFLALPAERAIEAFVRGTIRHLEREAARTPALVADRIAVLHAALGHREDSLRWLDLAARERSLTLPVTLATDPDLDVLRDDPAFRALRARLIRS